MRRAVPLAAAVLVAGCGSGAKDEPGFSGPTRTQSDPRTGISFAYPASWRASGRLPQPLIVQGPGPEAGSCTVSPSSGYPAGSTRSIVARRAGQLRSGGRRVTVVDEPGSSPPGAGVLLRDDRHHRGGHAALVITAGHGVNVACDSRLTDLARVDRQVFAPLIASVQVRRDETAEGLHIQLAKLDGLSLPAVLSGSRGVNVSGQTRTAASDATLLAQRILRETHRTFPERRLGIQLSDPDSRQPVAFGSYDPKGRSGFVQSLPGRPVPFTP